MKYLACIVLLGGSIACGGGGAGKSDTTPDTLAGSDEELSLHVPKVDPRLCSTREKRIETFDLNGDRRPDVWKLYKSVVQGGTRVEIMTCKQVDYDHDGRKDYVALYGDAGELIAEEFDFTFEGFIDARKHYDKKTGKVYLVERDSDHDRKPDVWEKYDRSGTVESIRRDRNADGKPDLWEQYDGGILVAILYDEDFDNRVDRRESRATKEPESAGPTKRPEIIDEAKPAIEDATEEVDND